MHCSAYISPVLPHALPRNPRSVHCRPSTLCSIARVDITKAYTRAQYTCTLHVVRAHVHVTLTFAHDKEEVTLIVLQFGR